MQNIVRKISLILAAVLCCGGAAACSTPNRKTISLEVWTYYNGSQGVAFGNYVDAFNDTVGRDKGIRVKHTAQGTVTQLASAVESSVIGAVGAKAKPDIFQSYVDDLWSLEDKYHVVAELDDYFTQGELDRFEADYLTEGRFGNGKLKLIPLAKSTECLLMNKDAWDDFAAGRTDVSLSMLSTMEGVVQVAKIYYEATGKAFYGRDAMANYVLVGAKSLGQEIITYDNGSGRVKLDRTAFRTLFDNYYVPYVKGWFSAQGRYRADDVSSGVILAYTGSTSSALNFPDEIAVDDDTRQPIECYSAAAPKFADGEAYAIQQGAGFAVMASNAERERACAEFLKFLTEAQRNTEFAVSMNYLPAVKLTDPSAEILDALVAREWQGAGAPTEADREDIIETNRKIISVYDTALATLEEATLWASVPTRVSAILRKVFEVCIQGDKSNVNAEGLSNLVNATDMRAAMTTENYDGPLKAYFDAPETYFDVWFAQLQDVVSNILGADGLSA